MQGVECVETRDVHLGVAFHVEQQPLRVVVTHRSFAAAQEVLRVREEQGRVISKNHESRYLCSLGIVVDVMPARHARGLAEHRGVGARYSSEQLDDGECNSSKYSVEDVEEEDTE